MFFAQAEFQIVIGFTWSTPPGLVRISRFADGPSVTFRVPTGVSSASVDYDMEVIMAALRNPDECCCLGAIFRYVPRPYAAYGLCHGAWNTLARPRSANTPEIPRGSRRRRPLHRGGPTDRPAPMLQNMPPAREPVFLTNIDYGLGPFWLCFGIANN